MPMGQAPALGRSFNPGQKGEIITQVCKRYGPDPEVLAQSGKKRNCAEARAVIALLVWYEDHLALIDLSERLGRELSCLGHAVNHLRNKAGQTPLDAAEELVRMDLLNLLRSARGEGVVSEVR
ncbi:MAG: hypothetical protein RDU20_12990 [Desulfomonilaceae bacterium]|nr:hypothetical protein [Desulfomonilaceae bacterium]